MATLPPCLSFLPEGGGQRREWGSYEHGPGTRTLPPLWREDLGRLMLCADKERAEACCPHPCQGRAPTARPPPAPALATFDKHWRHEGAGHGRQGRTWFAGQKVGDGGGISQHMHSSGTTSTACHAEGTGVCAKGRAIRGNPKSETNQLMTESGFY